MVMQVDLSPEYIDLMKTFADEKTIPNFINESVKKAIHNAAYDEKIRRGLKDLEEGRTVTYTEEEWEKLGREYGFH